MPPKDLYEQCPAPTGTHSFQFLVVVDGKVREGPMVLAVCSYCLAAYMGQLDPEHISQWVWGKLDTRFLDASAKQEEA